MLQLEILKNDLSILKEEYNNKQENLNNIYNYYNKMLDILSDYSDSIEDEVFRDAIPIPSVASETELFGEDYLYSHKLDDLYLFTSEWIVELLNYDSIENVINNSISYFSKEKEKDLDI